MIFDINGDMLADLIYQAPPESPNSPPQIKVALAKRADSMEWDFVDFKQFLLTPEQDP